MVPQPVLDLMFSRPPAEQFELLELLRDRLIAADRLLPDYVDPADSVISEEHQRILDERLDEYERDPHAGRPWEEVHAELLARLGSRR